MGCIEMQQAAEKEKKLNKIKTIAGLVICVILGFVLICNLTIIIKGSIDPDTPPSVFSITPLVVLSGSMSGDAEDHIEVGDLIFITDIEYSELKIGDVVTYRDGKSFTTHRIVGVGEDGFVTKGDANNTEDSRPLTEEKLIGIVKGRMPAVGNFALFLQTPLGMVVFVGLPLLAFVLYDVIRRQLYSKKEGNKTAELEAELERLRALAGEAKGDAEPASAENVVDPDLTEITANEDSSESEAKEEPKEDSAAPDGE